MSDDAIYRYFRKNPSYEGGEITILPCGVVTFSGSDEPEPVAKSGGTITVLPCGVITFSGSYTPSFANFIGYVGQHDTDLADELAAMEDSEEIDDELLTADIVDSGGIMVFGASGDMPANVNSANIKLAPKMNELMMAHEAVEQSVSVGIPVGTPASIPVVDINEYDEEAPFDITTI